MLTTYVVTYDLLTPGQNYSKLYEQLSKFPKWCHCLESVWFVVSEMNSAQIRDHLSKYIDNNDKLLVVASGKHGAWLNLSPQCSNWLKENL